VVNKMDTTGTFRKESMEFEGGGLTGVEKIMVLDGGRYEIVVNGCFEDLEGGVGLKRVWEFVPETGKKSNERVNVSSNS